MMGKDYLALSMQHHCLPAREVTHVGVLLRLLGQILELKRLQAHPDGHRLIVHSHFEYVSQ